MPASPNWRVIADDLQRRIKEDEFKPAPPEEGKLTDSRHQLPSELELREQYGASRATIRDALKWLTDRRVVETEAGRGTFVLVKRAPFNVTLSETGVGTGGGEGLSYAQDASVQGRTPKDTEPKVEIQAATTRVASSLQIEPGTQVVLRHQERFIDGQPWSLQTSYYPLEFVTLGATKLLEARDLKQGVVAYLGEVLDYKQVGYHDEIAARPPDQNEAFFFGLPERGTVVVFETYRTAFDSNGKAFRLTVTIWPSDRNRLHYNFGTVPADVVATPGPGDQPNDPSSG